MKKRNRYLALLLMLVMLLSMVPISSVAAAKAEEQEIRTAAVSVPSISAPFTTHPVVFIVEDTYQIAFATNATGIAWVEIGGVKYNDSTNGLMNWKSKYHKVTVPQAALDSAGSYKICFRSLSERPAYDAVPGSTQSRTYPFDPVPVDREPVFYCSSDQHNDTAYTLSISKTKSFDVYVLGGDYSGKLTEDTYVKLMLDMAGSVTQGRKPTIYTRGNHEIRGSQCQNLYRVSGYSETTGAYYTVKLPGIFAVVLDAGEDKVDSHEEYGGTVQFSTYRDAQTQWLREVVASREWEQYPVRMVFSHVPFSFYATDTFESVYSEWTELLDQMGVSLQVSGHTHKYGIYGPDATRHKSDPNYTTLIVSDRENGDYTYSSTFVTVGSSNYKIENVLHNNSIKATKNIPIFTNAYVNSEAGKSVDLSYTDIEAVDVKSATKATVPSISSPYTLHPTVFAVEDGYQIIFTTDATGMAWVEVGGKKYYDQSTGLMNWDSKYHSIRVPRVALDSARSYKTCFQSMSTRAAYSPAHGSTVSRTYPFTPIGDNPEPVILCLSDFRGLATEAKAVAAYKTFDALYVGGDYAYQGNTEANVKILLDTASAITTGSKPVIFTRGNREVRGNYSYLLEKASPTSASGKSYYTIEQTSFFAIVLDSGEDKLDSNSAYGNTIDYENLRKEQTEWLKEVLAEGKWKDYPTRVAFIHMPITRNTTAGLKEDFAEWIAILNQMGISLMISGHSYTHSLYASNASGTVGSPNFPTLVSCDVDNETYKYSGSYVTLGTSTLKVESVSAAKKLLKTSTTKNVTAPNYPATADQYLMFDFNNDSIAKDRYHSSVYGGLNFDLKANWDSETNTSATAISRGVLTFSPASETVTASGIYSRPLNNAKGQWAYRPLHYYTKSTDYCQVRFKIDNAVASTTDGIGKFRLDIDCPNDIDPSADVSKTYVRYEKSFKVADVVGNGYVTISFPLNSTAYTSMNWLNLVHPQFVNIKSASGSTAVFSLDYIYIGPQESFPQQDDTLFFDFTNTAEDRERYNSFTYNYLNFDDPANWTVYNASPMSTIADGALKLAVPTGNTDTSHSTRSRIDNVSALHFVPGKNDILQVRIQIKNAAATTENGIVTFRMNLDRSNTLVNASGTSRTWTNIPINFTLSDYVDKGWFILETKLTDAEYLASDWINLVHTQFLNMTNASGKTAEFMIDYIYIGPAEKNPTIGTVTFTDESGSVLETCAVNRSTPAAYTGSIPSKDYTESAHYTFLGWADQNGQLVDLNTLVTTTTVKSLFAEASHSFSYVFLNESAHSKSCVCGYTAEEAHSFTEDLCICGHEDVKEPTENASLKIGHTLNLASDISVNLAVSKSVLEGFDMDTVYILTELDLYEGNEKIGTRTIKLLPVEQGNYYYFTLTGLTAVNMNDRFRSVLYGTKDNQPYYSPVDDYSIADYAYSQLSKASIPESLKNLCAELLRYGAKAQIFKNYRTDAYADEKMTADQIARLTDLSTVFFGNTNRVLDDISDPTITWAGKALDLNSKVTVKFVFDLAGYEGDTMDLTLKLSYTDYSGATKVATLTNPEAYGGKDGRYAFSFDGLLAAELRSVISAQVYSDDRPISSTLQYSADTYGSNKTGALATLCKALWAYSDSAKAFFLS